MARDELSGATRAARGEGYSKGRARRLEIIHAASLKFAQNGFEGATMLDIAAACGISRAGLFHHFADKEALLTAVLEERDREDQERFLPYVAAPSGGIGVLRGIVDLADHNRHVPGLIDLFVRLSSEASSVDHPAHDYFIRRYQRIRLGTARALRSAARTGYLRHSIDPDESALELTALMDGLQLQWLLDSTVDMASHMRRAVAGLLNAEGRRAFDAFSHA